MSIDMDELEQLVAARGPPGAEYEVADCFETLIESHVDKVKQDDLGNVVATDQGEQDGLEIMLAAHTDELSFIVNDITDEGFLKFTWLGAHYTGNLPGQRVRVGPEDVLGVIGAQSRHRMSDEEFESLPEELFIDVGADSAEEVRELNIRIGDHATWDRNVEELEYGRITGRALDDRIGLAILLAVAEETDVDSTVHYVATVQEEPGLRGARMTGYSLDPDIAIAVDIFPGNHPGEDDDFEVELGTGPAVELADGVSDELLTGVLVNRQTEEWLRRAGDRAGVNLQYTLFIGGTTDATQLQQVRGGRHAGVISVPCRYTHSPVETLSLDDANDTVKTLVAALETPFPTRDEARRG